MVRHTHYWSRRKREQQERFSGVFGRGKEMNNTEGNLVIWKQYQASKLHEKARSQKMEPETQDLQQRLSVTLDSSGHPLCLLHESAPRRTDRKIIFMSPADSLRSSLLWSRDGHCEYSVSGKGTDPREREIEEGEKDSKGGRREEEGRMKREEKGGKKGEGKGRVGRERRDETAQSAWY